MKANTLSNVLNAIRATGFSEAISESDALAIVNALVCKFKPTSTVGDTLLTCALALDDELNNTPAPTMGDLAQLADYRRRSLAEFELTYGARA